METRDRIPARLPDRLALLPADAVRLSGWLGRRVDANAARRLLEADEERMLAGFRNRPGEQAWIGEHVGKFLHAATLALENAPEPRLRAKRDRVAEALIACQEPDGYLGTYVPDKRFGLHPGADWDVWVHKYCLLGLLAVHRHTGNPRALAACRRIGDLLLRTFGPGKRRLTAAGTHVGMAATSVLEPIVLLHRRTGDPRLLAFARDVVAEWNRPGGAGIVASLTSGKGVEGTANGKAYEMLSNLVGLCELARTTGERALLDPVLAAAADIRAHHRYVTGTLSRGEHFGPDFDLPNGESAHVGETCVTTTWIQLCAQLLRLTGDLVHGAEIERSLYNHLAAAQRPDGAQWCYYTALEGRKPYTPGINCCVSSGPRAMAMAPSLAVLRDGDAGLVINLLESFDAEVRLPKGKTTVRQRVVWRDDAVEVRLSTTPRTREPLRIRWRMPAWLGGRELAATGKHRDGFTTSVSVRWIEGDHGNAGRDAYSFGPWVLACEASGGVPAPTRAVVKETPHPVGGRRFLAAVVPRGGAQVVGSFVPFADAGADGRAYAVWMPGRDFVWPARTSLLADGAESRSRDGNQPGSICDDDPKTFAVTFDGTLQDEDWYAVAPDAPVEIRRVVFRHGRAFHDGGWFVGAPQVEAWTRPDGPWELLGTLDGYPATTATDPAGLVDGQPFALTLPAPTRVWAVRVRGVPAHGDNPKQTFSSCAELAATL